MATVGTTNGAYLMEQIVITNLDDDRAKGNLLQRASEDSNRAVKKIGIQGFPGLKFSFGDDDAEPVIIGGTGVFELDISNMGGSLVGLFFRDLNSFKDIRLPNPIIIDVLYQEVNKAESGGGIAGV